MGVILDLTAFRALVTDPVAGISGREAGRAQKQEHESGEEFVHGGMGDRGLGIGYGGEKERDIGSFR
jgi:hypothetical protein